MRFCTVALALLLVCGSWTSSVAKFAPVPPPAPRPELQLELKRGSLESVDDKGGSWQFEGGKVMLKGEHVADYAATRRSVKKGTDGQNTAMLTVTIFFLGKKPPENITLQGSHDYGSGEQTGSVSAASANYSAYIGKSFTYKNGVLSISK
jgi:hypothetical protein